MLSDLVDELIWPKVLRAPALACSPNRLISGCVGVFLISLILNLYSWLRSPHNSSDEQAETSELAQAAESATPSVTQLIESFMDAIVRLDLIQLAQTVIDTVMVLRYNALHNTWQTLILGILFATVYALVGGSISRSAAFEFAQGRYASREETIHFTLSRARQYFGAIVGPFFFAAILFLIIAIGGLLLSFPIVDLLGSVLYAFGLALGIIATVVLLLHVVALPLIIPALSVEGTDGFDAIQRSYAYVIGRPLRYFSYVLLLSILGFIAATVCAMLANVSQEMTDSAANLFFSHAAESALTGEGDLGATKSLAHGIIEAFRGVLAIIVAGYIASLFFTSSTMLYLAIRRICDGQGITEIWEPVNQ
jgi:hypothetical protein